MTRRNLYWFSNDLRLQDNATLNHACADSDELLMVYCVDPAWFRVNQYSLRGISHFRWQFLLQSLRDLNDSLEQKGQQLLICYGDPVETLAGLVAKHEIHSVYRSYNSGYNENQQWTLLKQSAAGATFHEFNTYTLYDRDQLNFSFEQMPASFAEFHRKVVPSLTLKHAVAAPEKMPKKPAAVAYDIPDMPEVKEQERMPFVGGETQGLAQLQDYFSSPYPSQHLEMSKSMDGWHNSSKMSPWLAHGCVSARKFFEELEHYQRKQAENDSTEALFNELLWREYLQWYALANGSKLFELGGVAGRSAQSDFDVDSFRSWCLGETDYPLVNACMKELNATGFVGPAARQITASCLIHELGLDWRYGAAYFEQQLVDHDVALNWGNWQLMAGAGSDPAARVHLDLQEQARLHDPDGDYVRRWNNAASVPSTGKTDAADWPMER